jgi:hypothetical protein
MSPFERAPLYYENKISPYLFQSDNSCRNGRGKIIRHSVPMVEGMCPLIFIFGDPSRVERGSKRKTFNNFSVVKAHIRGQGDHHLGMLVALNALDA